MRVLVTGGNGFIGSALVERLVAEGCRVRCLVHRSSEAIEGLGVELVRGSVCEPSSLLEAVEGVEKVFHLAGSGRAGDWGAREWFFQVNAQGTRNVIDAAVRGGVGRFVLVSSLAVHRFMGHRDADEGVPADQERYAYGASKAEAERHVRSVRARGDMETVVVRPGVVVFGPRDLTAFVHMAPMLERGRWTHVAGGRPLLCYSYVDNLVDGLVLAGSKAEAAGQVFDITDDLRPSWKGFISAVIAAFGARERTVSVPAPVGRVAGMAAEGVFRLVGAKKPPLITDYRTALVSKDFHFSCEKAKRVLGYRPRVPFERGLARTVEWYRQWKDRR